MKRSSKILFGILMCSVVCYGHCNTPHHNTQHHAANHLEDDVLKKLDKIVKNVMNKAHTPQSKLLDELKTLKQNVEASLEQSLQTLQKSQEAAYKLLYANKLKELPEYLKKSIADSIKRKIKDKVDLAEKYVEHKIIAMKHNIANESLLIDEAKIRAKDAAYGKYEDEYIYYMQHQLQARIIRFIYDKLGVETISKGLKKSVNDIQKIMSDIPHDQDKASAIYKEFKNLEKEEFNKKLESLNATQKDKIMSRVKAAIAEMDNITRGIGSYERTLCTLAELRAKYQEYEAIIHTKMPSTNPYLKRDDNIGQTKTSSNHNAHHHAANHLKADVLKKDAITKGSHHTLQPPYAKSSSVR